MPIRKLGDVRKSSALDCLRSGLGYGMIEGSAILYTMHTAKHDVAFLLITMQGKERFGSKVNWFHLKVMQLRLLWHHFLTHQE